MTEGGDEAAEVVEFRISQAAGPQGAGSGAVCLRCMASPMIRKQVYLGRDHDRKLKALAASRGCTEAEIIREALDRLPDPEGDALDQLRAQGLLAPKPDFPGLPRGAAARAEMERFERWLDEHPEDLRLSEAVLEDRGPR